MTDKQKKLLMEYLGKTWDDSCINQDFNLVAALVRRAAEKNEWHDFYWKAKHEWHWNIQHGMEPFSVADFFLWFISDSARTCDLMTQWIEEARK